MSVCTLPIQLTRPLRPGTPRSDRTRRAPTPVRYAYCLLDLAAEEGTHPGQVFRTSTDMLYHTRRISGEVVWQLACRTNAQGYLVPVQPGPSDNPFLQNDTAAHVRINHEQPLLVRPGMRFNLYWTYHADLFQQAQDPDATTLTHEYLLHRCSTYFDREQRMPVRAVLEQFAHTQDLHDDHGGDVGWRRYQDDRFFRALGGTPPYRRTVLQLSTQGFFLRPEDEDLRRAMEIAGKIEQLAQEPEERGVMREVNALYHVLHTIDRYRDRPASRRDLRGDLNGIMDQAVRERSSLGGLRGNLVSALRDLNRYIKACGERLAPLLDNALLQACSHYERPVAQRYAERLMNAMGLALVDDFYHDFLRERTRFSLRTRHAVLDRVATDPLGTFLRAYTFLNGAGVFSAADLADKTMDWMGALIPRLTSERPQQVAAALNRLNQFIYNIEHLDHASGAAPDVVRAGGEDIHINALLPDGTPTHFSVRGALRAGTALLGMAGKLMSMVNYYFAFRDLSQDHSFKNYVSAFSSTVEAATAFDPVKARLAQAFGLSEAVVTRIGGVATIIVAGIEALDNISEGNNVAAIGNTVQALGGVLAMTIGTTGGAGVVVALVVVAGAVIVHWSLTPDARVVQAFRHNHESLARRHLRAIDRILDYQNDNLSAWDRYLREREESY